MSSDRRLIFVAALFFSGALLGKVVCPQKTREIELSKGTAYKLAYCQFGESVYYLPPLAAKHVYYIPRYQFTTYGDVAAVYDVELRTPEGLLAALRKVFPTEDLVDTSKVSLNFRPNEDAPFPPMRIETVNPQRVILRFDEAGSAFYERDRKRSGQIALFLILQSTFSIGGDVADLELPIELSFEPEQATRLPWAERRYTRHPPQVQAEIVELLSKAKFGKVPITTPYTKEQSKILERLLEIETTYLPSHFWEPLATFYGAGFEKKSFIHKLETNISIPSIYPGAGGRASCLKRPDELNFDYPYYLDEGQFGFLMYHVHRQLELDLCQNLHCEKGYPTDHAEQLTYLKRLAIINGQPDGTVRSILLTHFPGLVKRPVFDGRGYDSYFYNKVRELDPGYYVLFFGDIRVTSSKKRNWVRAPRLRTEGLVHPKHGLAVVNDPYLDPDILTQLRSVATPDTF